MKRMIGWIGLLVATAAIAQSAPQNSVDIKWVLPTTGVDGTPLTGANALTKVQVYIANAPIADTASVSPTLEVLPNGSTIPLSYTYNTNAGATIYVRLRACNTVCSAFSAEASKFVDYKPGVKPLAPTNVVVTLTLS